MLAPQFPKPRKSGRKFPKNLSFPAAKYLPEHTNIKTQTERFCNFSALFIFSMVVYLRAENTARFPQSGNVSEETQ